MNARLVWSLVVPIAWLAMWVIESRWPARRFISVPRWGWRGAAFFLLTAVVGSLVPALWTLADLRPHAVLDLSELGYWGAPVGLLLTTFVAYWWHRAAHRFDAIWLFSHQLHHSAPRIDIPGAFFTHPFEVAVKGTIAFILATIVLGLSSEAATAVATGTALLSIFQHWNVRTPRALGFILPRPEMHVLHHEYNVHARNYGELPIWDLVFGTLENPRIDPGEIRVGFSGSPRVSDMLLMRNVSG